MKRNRFSGTPALASALALLSATYLFTERVASAQTVKDALGPVTATVETGDELHFVRPGEWNKAALVLKNGGKISVRARLSFGIKERANQAVPLTPMGAVDIPPGGEVRRPLTSQQIGPRLGIKYVDWQLSHDGQRASGHASFAVLNPVGVTPGVSGGFVFGNAGIRHGWDVDLKERIIRTAAIVGAESLRGDTDWMGVQPGPGEWRWERTDETFALLSRYGAQLQNLVAYGGHVWTKSPETLRLIQEKNDQKQQWRYPPRLDAWRTWVRAQAERYRGKIRYYEIWNEPDIGFWKGTAQQYLELLKSAHEEIKAADPDAIVMTGGFTSMDHRSHNRELFELTLREGQPYFDLLAYHRHGSFAMLQKEVDDKLIPLRKKLGVKEPLYFNETAMSRDYEREYDQAVELPKRLAFVWSRGAVGYHYFNVWNRATDTSSAQGYNMVNADFSPRPVWVAYNEMARLLRGRQFSHELNLGKGRWGFAFHGKGDFTGGDGSDYALVAWTEDAVLADAPLVLAVGAKASARVVDLMGNSAPLSVSGGRVVFTVRKEPQYLVIENSGTKPQAQGVLLEATPPGAVVPGGVQTLTVRLRNPLETPQTVHLTWNVPAPLVARSPLVLEKKVAGGGTAEATFEVALPPGAKLSGVTTRDVTVSSRIGSTKLSAEAAIPLPLGVRIPPGDFATRASDFTLNRAADVVNTNDIDPQTLHMTWKGPQDLSARAWLGRKEQSLRLRFEVRDDVHRQPHGGADTWQGDSVQMALAVPGQDGWFELGLAHGDNGQSAVHSWRAPRGFKGGDVFKAVTLQTQRQGDRTIYEARLPYAAFGLSDELLKRGVRFSFVVNDLDDAKETAREGYIRLSDGIAANKDPQQFPTVVIQ